MSAFRHAGGPQRQQGVSLLLLLLVFVLAIGAGGIIAYLIISRVDVTLILRDQPATAIIPQQIRGKAEVSGSIKLHLNDSIRTSVPIDQKVTIPIKDTLNIIAYFKGAVPLKLKVRLRDNIPLKQIVDLNTTVEAFLPELGTTISIPLRGKIPIDIIVPVDLEIPIDQLVNLDFVTPVTARIDQMLTVPLKTTINASVPIDSDLDVPVLNQLKAVVNLPTGPSKVVITQADLTLPLRTLKLGLTDDDAGDAAEEQP